MSSIGFTVISLLGFNVILSIGFRAFQYIGFNANLLFSIVPKSATDKVCIDL